MTARIPIHFLDVGRRKVPTLEVTITMRRGRGALTESALIDAGSQVTIFSKDLLRLNGFPVDQAHEDKTGVHGLGGAERLFYIGPAVAAFEDITGDVHYLRVLAFISPGSACPQSSARTTSGASRRACSSTSLTRPATWSWNDST